ncbi:MAG TPA: branched-chain amino acid ABC transporter permease [Actinomycetota bacterium]|nr:branched-chain amino acid ABC transporter permease [Actinomycetota bacterium]
MRTSGGRGRRLGAAAAAACALALAAGPARAASEVVRGTIEGPRGPVEGVAVAVETAAGDPVGRAVTGPDGTWRVRLPRPGEYTATLDVATLPDGLQLRIPDNDTLEFDVQPGQDRTLLYPLVARGAAPDDAGPSAWERAAQLTADGIVFGAIVALSALGLSLIFGTTGFVNFAHGELVTVGAVVAFLFNASGAGPRVHLVAAAAIAVAAGALAGAALERGLWRPLRARRVGLFPLLVVSIGLSLLLRHVVLLLFGGRTRPFADYTLQTRLELGPVALAPRDLFVAGGALVVLAAVGLALQRTRLGKAIRAVSDDRDLAECSGIDVRRVVMLVWVGAGAIAALGGVFLGMVEQVGWSMGFNLLLPMFAGVILGGLGTAFGVVAGSLVIGVVTQLSTLWFPTELKFLWALVALVAILLVRPQGILGRAQRVG